jgi:hypothetical protein
MEFFTGLIGHLVDCLGEMMGAFILGYAICDRRKTTKNVAEVNRLRSKLRELEKGTSAGTHNF